MGWGGEIKEAQESIKVLVTLGEIIIIYLSSQQENINISMEGWLPTLKTKTEYIAFQLTKETQSIQLKAGK